MERGAGSIWCLVLLIPGLLPGCWSQGSHTVIIDGYRHNSPLTSGDSVPLGTQIILVCRVVGLPYGTPLSYNWTCPNGPCEVEGYYGRKVYNEHIMAVNTTSTSDGGTYTCQVTAAGGQEATGNFTLRVTGGRVVHSHGRLIPHEFPITDLQQISGPDGIGGITCTVSSGTAKFLVNGGRLETGGLSQTGNGATATLVVNPSDVAGFQNRGLYCPKTEGSYFYLFLSSANPLSVPSLTVNSVTNSVVVYQVQRNDDTTDALNTGYEVTRFGVPMIGQYVNTGSGRTVTISPVVPGAQYRITARALHSDGRRSATPVVVDATTGEAGPSSPKSLSITREFQNGIELNWLPPTEPNGEVHYVIYYTPEGGTEQSIDTGSDLAHYNLTGLERNRVYTNIAVQAVNSVGRSGRSAVIAQYNHTLRGTTSTGPPSLPGPPPRPSNTTDTASMGSISPPGPRTQPRTPHRPSSIAAPTSNPLLPAVVSLVVVVLLLITCVALLALALAVTATKLNNLRTEKAHTDPLHCYNKTGGGEKETKDRIYDEVGEGTDPIGGQKGHYQELKLETLDRREYDTLHGGH